MFDKNEVRAFAQRASAEGLHGVAHVADVTAVESGEGFECGGEDLGWEGDFEFGRRERIYAPDGGFVERYGETMLDLALPEEFEDLVWVGGKCEGSCGRGAVLVHDPLVIGHSDGVVFLDTVDEHLANAFHRVLHRQAKEGGESGVLNVPLKEERPNSGIRYEIRATHRTDYAAHS